MGMFGFNVGGISEQPMPQMGPQIQMPQAAPKKKGGMFGSGGGSWVDALQAALGGYLAARGNPVGMAGLQMLQQKRQQALEEQQYQRRRGEGLEDYAKKQQIESQYGRAAQPHYFEDNSGNQWAIGADGQPKMVHKDDLPFKLVPNGLGGVVPVDLRTLMQQQGQAPVGKITPLDEGGPGLGGPGGFRY